MSKDNEPSATVFTNREVRLIEMLCQFHLGESRNPAAMRDSKALLLKINPEARCTLAIIQPPRKRKRFYGIRKPQPTKPSNENNDNHS